MPLMFISAFSSFTFTYPPASTPTQYRQPLPLWVWVFDNLFIFCHFFFRDENPTKIQNRNKIQPNPSHSSVTTKLMRMSALDVASTGMGMATTWQRCLVPFWVESIFWSYWWWWWQIFWQENYADCLRIGGRLGYIRLRWAHRLVWPCQILASSWCWILVKGNKGILGFWKKWIW